MIGDNDRTSLDHRSRHGAGVARAVLVVYLGEQASNRVIEIADGAQLTLGRAPTATIVLDSEKVSRIHARIQRDGAAITIEDAGSRNGTWVNGARITASCPLASGDEIMIGPATIVVGVTSHVAARCNVESTRRLDDVLAAEVDRGRRYRRVFSLLMIRIEGDPQELDAAIDRTSARLRTMDVLAEYAPSELAIVLPELDAASADGMARQLLAAADTRDYRSTAELAISGGLAAFPEHGTTPGELIARARAAIASASGRRAGTLSTPPEDTIAGSEGVVIGDRQMERVYELARRVADHSITVLIAGETGVGKEVVAAAIHDASSRRTGRFVKLNCASLPETLLDTALFGHEKGAFTGADRRTPGFFEVAHGGTLFLDEIGEISPAMQAKLLRVLEEHRFVRVGGTEEVEADVRVVCATNRDLDAESQAGTFRRDLFFRISGFTILVPPLRERPDEITLLAEHFIAQASGGRARAVLAPAAVDALRSYSWPGNVRELRNAVERAMVVRSGRVIELDDLPDYVRDHAARAAVAGDASDADASDSMRDRFAQRERSAIVTALEAAGGNQSEAAKRLGLSRRALIYRMEKYGLKAQPASRR